MATNGGIPTTPPQSTNAQTPISNEKTPDGGVDAFGRAVAQIAVAQICEGAGFQSCQQSALEALADIAVRYLCDLGKAAHYYAGLAGRTDCNVFDVIHAMEDMFAAQGFAGASDVISHSVSGSGTVREIMQYTKRAEEIPFARPVPRFPVVKKRKLLPTFLQMKETPAHQHIPPWLPAFPDSHTYKSTPVWNERKTDPQVAKIEQARQRRKAERSLVNLEQRLASASGFSSPGLAMETDGKGKNPSPSPNPNANSNNPFLAPPVGPDEKQVSPVKIPSVLVRPAVKLPSVLEAFAPAIDAVKQGLDQVEELDGQRKNPRGSQALSDERPLVQFKFDFGKKAQMAAHATGALRNETPLSSWFSRDEEIDDKKRRVEQILKEAMENPHDLVQL